MIIPQLPFKRTENDMVILTGPVLLTCGCGNVTARWANIQQGLATKLPQGKPKSSKIISDWIKQNNLDNKWPILKQHTFGVVVGETDKGFEMVNVMAGAPAKAAEDIGKLIARSKRV